MAKKQDKTKEIFGLMKIPDAALLKVTRTELGKAEAYIEELKYENEQLKTKLAQYESK